MPPRRLLRTALVTFVWFFALAASAHAECAWVLWSETPPDPADWRILEASTAEGACRLAMKRRIEANRAVWGGSSNFEFHGSDTGFFVLKKSESGKMEPMSAPITFHCLPDTIDPRGPKGK